MEVEEAAVVAVPATVGREFYLRRPLRTNLNLKNGILMA